MPVKIDDSGRRSVEAEVEVPGTPEEVWQAIATGPGISAWFVPSEVEERVGGAVVCNFGPGMESLSSITDWEPPHRFVADSRDDLGPEDPTVATEWSVQARSGDTCVVRVVHSWFMESDAWDEQYEWHTYGWLSFFRVLRSYLTHFRGQPSAAFQVVGTAPEPKEAAWAALAGPLGLAGAEVGQRVSTPAGAPPLAGMVEWAGQPEWPEELLIRLEEPAPGLAHLVPHPMGGQIIFTIRFYLYGDNAEAAVARAEPAWQAWVNERFPLPAEASAAD
jgi:uncharacterized protein YndB with AHSA1/START domain